MLKYGVLVLGLLAGSMTAAHAAETARIKVDTFACTTMYGLDNIYDWERAMGQPSPEKMLHYGCTQIPKDEQVGFAENVGYDAKIVWNDQFYYVPWRFIDENPAPATAPQSPYAPSSQTPRLTPGPSQVGGEATHGMLNNMNALPDRGVLPGLGRVVCGDGADFQRVRIAALSAKDGGRATAKFLNCTIVALGQ